MTELAVDSAHSYCQKNNANGLCNQCKPVNTTKLKVPQIFTLLRITTIHLRMPKQIKIYILTYAKDTHFICTKRMATLSLFGAQIQSALGAWWKNKVDCVSGDGCTWSAHSRRQESPCQDANLTSYEMLERELNFILVRILLKILTCIHSLCKSSSWSSTKCLSSISLITNNDKTFNDLKTFLWLFCLLKYTKCLYFLEFNSFDQN